MKEHWSRPVRMISILVLKFSKIGYISFLLSNHQAYLNIPGLFDEFANNIDRALPIILYYDHHDLSTQQSITRKIKEFYFNNDVRREKETNITNVCTVFLLNQFECWKAIAKWWTIQLTKAVDRWWLVFNCYGLVSAAAIGQYRRFTNLCIPFNTQRICQLYCTIQWRSGQILWSDSIVFINVYDIEHQRIEIFSI